MKNNLIIILLISVALIQFGCSQSDDESQSDISAMIDWTQDVSEINLIEFGVNSADFSKTNLYKLTPGKGTISWVSSGVTYSKDINVKSSGIEDSENDIECEQEGEYEGENEGCVFSFSFSGNTLAINN